MLSIIFSWSWTFSLFPAHDGSVLHVTDLHLYSICLIHYRGVALLANWVSRGTSHVTVSVFWGEVSHFLLIGVICFSKSELWGVVLFRRCLFLKIEAVGLYQLYSGFFGKIFLLTASVVIISNFPSVTIRFILIESRRTWKSCKIIQLVKNPVFLEIHNHGNGQRNNSNDKKWKENTGKTGKQEVWEQQSMKDKISHCTEKGTKPPLTARALGWGLF